MAYRKRREERFEKPAFDIAGWNPATELGKAVKENRITSIEQIYNLGKRIQEVEIVDALIPDIKSEVIEVKSVQRMTKNNRKMKFRVTAIVGDMNGHVGVGAAKDIEVKASIDSAIRNAKRNIISVMLGCGSWQCTCGQRHSLPLTIRGKCGSVEVIIKPGPRGLGIVASKSTKAVLQFAGVKDAWSFSRGQTSTRYNTLMAVIAALNNMEEMKNLDTLESNKAVEHNL